jgi:cell wall-associated NlpC family hydrolase
MQVSELSNEPTLNDQIGTLSGDTPLSGGSNPLGEVTFDGAGQSFDTPSDPMSNLHLPTVPKLKQQTTTTVTASGGGPGGQPPSGPLSQNDGSTTTGLVGYARKFLGVPYVWGGTSPTGFDCSGFVQYVYKQFGVNLPRISADQARAGKRVSFDRLQPGDLVAVDNSSRNNGADHIGIYIGNGLVINAPRPGRSVQIDRLDAFSGGWGVRIQIPGGRKPRSVNPAGNKPRSY